MSPNNKFLIVIPARYKSSRFPGKPLAEINGKSMIKRVWDICLQVANKNNVIVATDDRKIISHCEKLDMNVLETSQDCMTGTDRIAEVSKSMKADFYVNVQGDEPVIKPADIKKIINEFNQNRDECVCGMTKIISESEFSNLNIPKVVFDQNNNLLYFSRAQIPSSKMDGFNQSYKQVCIYALSRKALKEYGLHKEKTSLEKIEDIELIRLIEKGFKVKMVEVSSSSIAVDTPEDLKKVISYLNGSS